jgi:pyruvate kinase
MVMERRAKIVATMGPSSRNSAVMVELLKAGANVARLNFSHGAHAEHAQIISALRGFSKSLNIPITILQDLQGPKIRTGAIPGEGLLLTAGELLTLSTTEITAGRNSIFIDFDQLPLVTQVGNRILLDDGNLELQVTSIEPTGVNTIVTLGGVLKSHKGVNLPGAHLDIPAVTEKDMEDLAFGLQMGVDMVALSFVRTPEDIRTIQRAISEFAPNRKLVPIIAKLERPEALNNLDEILQIADGVMVARGDLGVEMSPEAVPIAQKRIIDTANRYGKLVITATQMLDSMINNPRPTRAEASDVANAIFDGTDAVMLSGETASGKYPVQAVKMMNAIICTAEQNISSYGNCQITPTLTSDQDDTYYLTLAARELAHDKNVAAISVFTTSGRTALLMSKARPEAPILAFTPDPDTYQRMGMYWGVESHLVQQVSTVEAMLQVVDTSLLNDTTIQAGQQVVLICGYPVQAVRATNMALLHTVGSASNM